MNKKLITLAVAAAMAAPIAVMADATMYGKLHVSIDYQDVKPLAGDVDGFKGWGINGINPALRRGGTGDATRSNRVGIKGSEDLGGGLKAIWQVELGVTLGDRDGAIINGDRGSAISMRNSFVGLAGNWGTFLVGRHDTPLKISTGALDLFSDTQADYNATIRFNDIRADNTVTYISPSWGGFQLAAAVIPGGGGTVSGDYNINSDSISQGWSLAGIYKNGPWYASAAYEAMGSELGYTDPILSSNAVGDVADTSMPDANGNFPVIAVDDMGDPATTTLIVADPKDFNKWRIGLGILDWNGFTLTGIYENVENDFFANKYDIQRWQVQAGYAFGNNMIKAMYGQEDRDIGDRNQDFGDFNTISDLRDRFNDKDRNAWAVAFDHNFSKRTRAYVLYTDVNDDAAEFDDWTGFSLGMIHKF
jgi:predicted porin